MEYLIPASALQDWLGESVYVTNFVYIDRWSMVHFTSGVILGILLAWYFSFKKTLAVGFLFLVLYEVIEGFLVGYVFHPETPLDILWDLIIGMVAISLMARVVHYFRKREVAQDKIQRLEDG